MQGHDITHTIEATLTLLLFVTVGMIFAPRFRFPVEVVLVIGSLLLSAVPGLPVWELDPHIVFTLFLPPILFSAGYFTSWRDFKANLRPIFLLSVGLVLFTIVSVAACLYSFGLGISWPVAFLLGAIVSPTDASAATAVIKKLGVPRQLLTLLEGESLMNDATALVAYRFALAAVVSGTAFSVQEASFQFVWVILGGAVIGLCIGFAGMFVMKRLKDSQARTLFSILLSFTSYLAAERIGVSGILSTVVTGLYCGRKFPAVLDASARYENEASWATVLFIINCLAFTLTGLQLPQVLSNLEGYSNLQLALFLAAISLAVCIVRFIWVFSATYIPRLLFSGFVERNPMPPWPVAIVLSWTGMRGIVSLAAALAIPAQLSSGVPFPHRDLIIFLSYGVILASLLVPAVTLPSLMKRLGMEDDGESLRDEIKGRLILQRAAINTLEELRKKGTKISAEFPPELIAAMLARQKQKLRTLESNLDPHAYSPLYEEDQALRKVIRKLLTTERKALHDLRVNESIHDEVFHLLTRELDLEEMRLNGKRI